MQKSDWILKAILLVIAIVTGLHALRPLADPPARVLAQPATYDHIFIASTAFLYKGQQGMLVLDRRNASVWFFPKAPEGFLDPVFVMRLPFEKIDQPPR
jgi:hypothetical protein